MHNLSLLIFLLAEQKASKKSSEMLGIIAMEAKSLWRKGGLKRILVKVTNNWLSNNKCHVSPLNGSFHSNNKNIQIFPCDPEGKCIPFCVMAIHVISCVFLSILCVSQQNIFLMFLKLLEGKCYLLEHPLSCFQLYEKNAT